MTIDEYTLIADLFGKKRSETRPAESKTSTIVGVATSDSASGSVRVRLNSDLTGGEDGELVIPTDAHIVAGDIVSISLVGGTAKAPRVTGTVGGGDRIYASLVETNQLVATKADITDLTAAEGRIGTLEANALTASSAVITDLQADTAKVHDLTANELSAATGYVGDLVAGNLTAANLISDHQTIGSLDVSQISADHATIASLDSNYAQIDLANIANGTIKTAMIDDGQITSAKILNGTIANADIANGTIENAKIKDGTIESAKIKDGTIQNADIANGTIETAKIHDGAITNAKIADATIDSAKITYLTGANGWIDRLMVQTGLIANDGTVFTLDAIKVNAASITAGTIDIERIVVTDSQTGDKHMVTWDSENEEWDAVKLDGDVLGDRTIAADKIVAHDITVQEITTENLVGTGGWINLAAGTFQYVNATSGDGISWDGTNLTINAGSLMTTISNTYATQTALANETNARKAVYGTSSTGATTQTKAVTCSNFTRYTGAEVTVKFGNANTYNGAPKLNVNSTGAAEIRSYTGTALTKGEREWAAGSTLTFSFDGTYWRMLDNGMTGRMSTAESSITQNADKISLIVTDGSTSGNLSLTADAMTYIGNNVVIKDSTGSSTVITGGKLYTNLISVGDLSDGSSYSTTSQMNTAISTAVDNIDAIAEQQQIYIQASSVSDVNTIALPSAWVEESGESTVTDSSGTVTGTIWTTKHPTYTRERPVTFVATQRRRLDGTIACTAPLPDDTTAVIDGGNLITGSVQARHIEADSLTLSHMSTAVKDTLSQVETNSNGISTLNGKAEGLAGDVGELKGMGEVVDSHDGQLQTIMNSLKFAEGELELKTQSGDDSTSVALTSEKMEFRANGTEVAYVSNEKLYIRNAQVLDNMQMGGFAWIPRSNGNLSLKWLGGVSHMNLILKTGDLSAWTQMATSYGTVTASGSSATISASGNTANRYVGLRWWVGKPIADLEGSVTISFEVMSEAWSSVTDASPSTGLSAFGVQFNSTDTAIGATSTTNKAYRLIRLNNTDFWKSVPTATNGQWLRFESKPFTFDSALLTGDSSKGVGANMLVYPMVRCNGTVSIRNIKLEIGTEATPWSVNPND